MGDRSAGCSLGIDGVPQFALAAKLVDYNSVVTILNNLTNTRVIRFVRVSAQITPGPVIYFVVLVFDAVRLENVVRFDAAPKFKGVQMVAWVALHAIEVVGLKPFARTFELMPHSQFLPIHQQHSFLFGHITSYGGGVGYVHKVILVALNIRDAVAPTLLEPAVAFDAFPILIVNKTAGYLGGDSDTTFLVGCGLSVVVAHLAQPIHQVLAIFDDPTSFNHYLSESVLALDTGIPVLNLTAFQIRVNANPRVFAHLQLLLIFALGALPR